MNSTLSTHHGFLLPHIDSADDFFYELTAKLVTDEREYIVSAVSSPQDFIQLCIMYKLTHLWIMPEYGHEMSLAQSQLRMENYNFEDYDFRAFENKYSKLVSSIVGRCLAPRSDNVNVVFLAQCGWSTLHTTEQLQKVIGAVEAELGVSMKGSPTSVGLRFLEKIDQRYFQRYFADPDVNKAALKAACAEAAKPLIWSRLPRKDELVPRPKLFLIALDKRAAYPRAASEERQGVGKPRHQIGGEFNPKLPGVWDVEVHGLGNIDTRLPSPLWAGWNRALVTPLVKMLIAFGCTVTVREALVWDTSAPVFDRWAQELWKFRQNCPEAKFIMNNTLGFTINGDDMEDEKFRPDWHAGIVGGLRALMMYNAAKVARESGFYPIGAYIDALYYLTPYENSVPGLIEAPKSLGGYALKWCIPVDEQVQGWITDPSEHKHFNMLLNKLNRKAGMADGSR